jgi:hypothetical protein
MVGLMGNDPLLGRDNTYYYLHQKCQVRKS